MSSQADKDIDSAQTKYANMNEKLVNGTYLKEAINESAPLAREQALAAGNQAQTAARQAGMSKGRAALMGSDTATKAYGSSFNNMLNTSMGNKVGAISNQNQNVSNLTNERQNRHKRWWDNAEAAASAVGGFFTGTSDENAKDLVQTDDEAWDKSKVEAFLKKHQKGKSIKDLKWEAPEDE